MSTVLGRVLVVAGDEAWRSALLRSLDEGNFAAQGVADPVAAASIFALNPPDVLIYDLALGLAGFRVLGREAERKREHPVALVVPDSQPWAPMLAASIDGIVPRDAAPTDIRQLVRRRFEQRRLEETLRVFQSARRLMWPTDTEAVPRDIVKVARDAMAAERVSLLLLGADGLLYVACADGLPESVEENVRLCLGERIVGRVALGREPIVVRDLRDDVRFADLASQKETGSSIVHPLVASDRLVGVLCLSRGHGRRPFSENDLESIAPLAEHATRALEQMRLTREAVAAERLACIGRMTSGLAHEINNPLSFVMSNLHFIEGALGPHAVPGGASAGTGAADEFQELGIAVAEALAGAERIRATMNDLRVLAASGGQPSCFSVDAVVRSATRVASAAIREHADLSAESGEVAEVIGSAAEICHLIVELLLFVAEACGPRGGRRGRIGIRSRPEGERAIVTIHGVRGRASGGRPPLGVSTELPASETAGMWISRQILRRHGGRLQVDLRESDVVLTVELPRAGTGSARRNGDPAPPAEAP